MVNDSKNLSLLTFGMKEKSDDYDYSNGCFSSNDTLGLLHDIEHPDNTKVLYIAEHVGDIEDQKKEIKEIVDVFKNAKNWVVISSSYVSVVDFPKEKYYDPQENPNYDGDKKPVPYDEVIAKQDKMFEELGFVDYNFYVNYENSHAWIYPNELGLKVVELARELQNGGCIHG